MIDVNQIIRYENGDMDIDEMVEFFTNLIQTGFIHHLQGHYHRVANQLIQDGLIVP